MTHVARAKPVAVGLLAGSLTIVTGCSLVDVQDVSGSGDLVTIEHELSGFDALDLRRGYEVRIEPGAAHAVSVTADDNVVEHLELEVVGNSLRLDIDDAVNLDAAVSVMITMPLLERVVLHGGVEADLGAVPVAGDLDLDLTGGSELACAGVEVATLRADVSGGSDVACTGLLADALVAEVDGGSSLQLTGESATAELSASGDSHFELAGLELGGASVELSGDSSADLAVSGVLEAVVENSSTLRYAGEPVLGAMDVDASSSAEQRR